MLNVTILVGNPKVESRTRRIAQMLVDEIFVPTSTVVNVIELALHSSELFDWPSDNMAELSAVVAKSDLVVFATPTYKASYTGLLKAFLDRYPANGLKNVVALTVMTGADQAHSMAPNVTLVPLLMELGAIVPIRGQYFNTTQMDRIDEIVTSRAQDVKEAIDALQRLKGSASPVRIPTVVEA
jgi:FMN reductase